MLEILVVTGEQDMTDRDRVLGLCVQGLLRLGYGMYERGSETREDITVPTSAYKALYILWSTLRPP